MAIIHKFEVELKYHCYEEMKRVERMFLDYDIRYQYMPQHLAYRCHAIRSEKLIEFLKLAEKNDELIVVM